VLQGYFASAGSVARIVFPIAAGHLSEAYGSSFVFALVIIVLLIALFFVLINRKTLTKLSMA
jgi:MFS family permease